MKPPFLWAASLFFCCLGSWKKQYFLPLWGGALQVAPSSLVWWQRGGSGWRFTFKNSGTFIFTPRQYIGSERHLWIMMTWNGWKRNEVISQKVISDWGGLGHYGQRGIPELHLYLRRCQHLVHLLDKHLHGHRFFKERKFCFRHPRERDPIGCVA